MKTRLTRPSLLFLASLLVSLAAHIFAAVGLLRLADVPLRARSDVRLERSHVELSIAETPAEDAAPVPAMPQERTARAPSPAHDETRLPPPEAAPPAAPTFPVPAAPTFPVPAAADLPKPDDPHAQVVTPAPRQAHIDAPPKPTRDIRPDYPHESRLRGEEGEVVLEIEVDASGAAVGVRVVASSGFPLLDEAAVRAVRSARFAPATANGAPVPAIVRLPLRFALR